MARIDDLPLPPTASALPVVAALAGLDRTGVACWERVRAAKGDIYTLSFGVGRVIVVNHPRHARHILQTRVADYLKEGVLFEAGRALVGRGSVAVSGDAWRRKRRIVQPVFHRRMLERLAGPVAGVVDAHLDRLAAAGGAPVNVMAVLDAIVGEVIVDALLGPEGLPADERAALIDALRTATGAIVPMALRSTLPGWLPVPGGRRFRAAIDAIDRIIYAAIARRRAAPLTDATDVLSQLLVGDDRAPLTDTEVRDELVTAFAGGFDTTVTTLSWALDQVARHPDVQRQLAVEVHDVLAGRRPTVDDVAAMPCTRAVFREAARLFGITFLPRTCRVDDELDGYRVPAGAVVLVMVYAMQRHPEVWPDPAAFDPSRFMMPDDTRHPLAWMPFGAGQRKCVGATFAETEAALILSRIVQRFTLRPVPGRAPRATGRGPVLTPVDGVWLALERRSTG